LFQNLRMLYMLIAHCTVWTFIWQYASIWAINQLCAEPEALNHAVSCLRFPRPYFSPGKWTLHCHFLSIAHIVTAFSLHALSQPFHCMPFRCLIINAKLLPVHSMLGYCLIAAFLVTALTLLAWSLTYHYTPSHFYILTGRSLPDHCIFYHCLVTACLVTSFALHAWSVATISSLNAYKSVVIVWSLPSQSTPCHCYILRRLVIAW